MVEEVNSELREARSGDPTKNGFQVSADALEPKPAEIRKRGVGSDWHMR